MKKLFYPIITFVMILALCLNTVCPVSFAEETGKADQRLADTIEVLKLFDIIPDYYDYNISVYEEITRAEFVSAVARLLKATALDDGNTYYYDVPPTHWAYKEISSLTMMGIINGAEEKLFHPDSPIHINEAYKILLSAMGYDKHAQANGGYPAGYRTVARRIEIDDLPFGNTDILCRGDMYLLIRQAMTTEIAEIEIYGDENDRVGVSEETLLSVYHQAYYDTGVLNGAGYACLDGSGLLDRETVKIEQTQYHSLIDISGYLAEDIEFYYSRSKGESQGTILWAKPSGVSKTLSFTADHNVTFNPATFELSYESETGTRRNIDLSKKLIMVYNGSVVTKDFGDIFQMPRYTAKLIAVGNEYQTAIVKAYESLVVGAVNQELLTVYDVQEPQKKLLLDADKYEKFTMQFKGAAELPFHELESGFVLDYYLSKDKKILEVQATAEKVTGVLESFIKENNGYRLVIDGAEYFMYSDKKELITAGGQVTAYLDTQGCVVYLDYVNTSYIGAYLIAATVDGTFGSKLYVKLLHENGKVMDVEAARKVILDGVSLTPDETYKALKVGGSFARQFVLVKMNAEGQLTYIDRAAEPDTKPSPSNILRINSKEASNLHFRRLGIMGEKSVLNNDTKFFVVPSDDSDMDETKFTVITKNDINEDEKLTAETYTTEEKVGYEKYILLKGYTAARVSGDAPVLVEEITQEIDENGDVVDCINGYSGKNQVKYLAAEDVVFTGTADKIEKGMVVRVTLDMDGRASAYQILYDYRTPEKYSSTLSVNDGFYVGMGYVNDVVGDVVKFGYTSGANIDRVFFVSDAPVLVYNTKDVRNPLTVGTIQEARTYQNELENCSKVFVMSSYSQPKLYVVYL